MNASSTRPVQVGIVAPPLVAWGLERLVRSGLPRLDVATTWSSVDEVAQRPPPASCDVVVADLPADESLDAITRLRAVTTATLLLVSGSSDLQLLDRAILSGARGVVRRADAPAMLLKAIERIAQGEYWTDRSAIGRIFLALARDTPAGAEGPESTRIASLTPRERRTIAALVSDAAAPAKLLADRLCISEHTLRNHLTSIYQKLGVANRLDLYAYATRNGLARPPGLETDRTFLR